MAWAQHMDLLWFQREDSQLDELQPEVKHSSWPSPSLGHWRLEWWKHLGRTWQTWHGSGVFWSGDRVWEYIRLREQEKEVFSIFETSSDWEEQSEKWFPSAFRDWVLRDTLSQRVQVTEKLFCNLWFISFSSSAARSGPRDSRVRHSRILHSPLQLHSCCNSHWLNTRSGDLWFSSDRGNSHGREVPNYPKLSWSPAFPSGPTTFWASLTYFLKACVLKYNRVN